MKQWRAVRRDDTLDTASNRLLKRWRSTKKCKILIHDETWDRTCDLTLEPFLLTTRLHEATTRCTPRWRSRHRIEQMIKKLMIEEDRLTSLNNKTDASWQSSRFGDSTHVHPYDNARHVVFPKRNHSITCDITNNAVCAAMRTMQCLKQCELKLDSWNESLEWGWNYDWNPA